MVHTKTFLKWGVMLLHFIYAIMSYVVALQFRNILVISFFNLIPILLLIFVFIYKHDFQKVKERINRKSIILLLVLAVADFWIIYNVTIRYQSNSYYGAVCYNSAYLITIGSILLFYGWITNNLKIENFFWFIGVTFGSVMMFMLPLRAVPDENVHIYTAYQRSEIMLNHIRSIDETIPMRKTDREVFIEPVEMEYNMTMAEHQYALSTKSADTTYSDSLDYDAGLQNHDLAYYISGLAIAIAKLINLNGFYTIMAGRIANLLFYLILCYYAVKCMPFNKMIPVGIALLPMSLQQGMSYSYDSMIICTSLFVVAATFQEFFANNDDKDKRFLRLSAIVLFSIPLLMLKSHAYIFIGLFPIFMFLHKRFNMCKIMKYASYAFIAFMIMFLVYAIVEYRFEFPDIIAEPSNPIKWAENQQGYTIQYFINNPLKLIFVCAQTLFVNAVYYWKSAVSSYLGWLNILTSDKYVIGFSGLLLLSAVKTPYGKNYNIDFAVGIYSVFTIFITLFGIILALFITWTPLISTISLGVQGRYFIPIMVFVLFLIRQSRFELKNNYDYVLIFFITILLIMFFTSFLVRL